MNSARLSQRDIKCSGEGAKLGEWTYRFAEDAAHLRLLQERRNAFIHGDPEAIDDALVEATLARLESVQRGWICLFNKRCAGRTKRVAMWQAVQRHRGP